MKFQINREMLARKNDGVSELVGGRVESSKSVIKVATKKCAVFNYVSCSDDDNCVESSGSFW